MNLSVSFSVCLCPYLFIYIYIYPWALYSLALDLLWSAGGIDKEMRGKGESEVFLGSLLVGPLVSNDFVLVMGCFFFQCFFSYFNVLRLSFSGL